jgi:uncharacterized membrane protein
MMVNRFTDVKRRLMDRSVVIGNLDRRDRSFPLACRGARCDDRPVPDRSGKESTMKIATYGTMHLGVAFGVAYALTGSVKVAGAIALVEPAVQTVAYALHERAWRDPAAIRRGASRLAARMRSAVAPRRQAMRAVGAR